MKPQLTLKRVKSIIQDMDKSQLFGSCHNIHQIEKFHVYQTSVRFTKPQCLTRYRITLKCGYIIDSYPNYIYWRDVGPYCKKIETMTIKTILEER